MKPQEIRKILEASNKELQIAKSINEEESRLLRELEAEIGNILENNKGATVEVHPNTLEKLQEGIRKLEASHPRLTSLLNSILEALSGSGI
jgi:hypothetical protein